MDRSNPSVSPAREFAVDTVAPPPSETEVATFGMGCFWGPDARFGSTDGVVRTRVGYAGGTAVDPTYHSLGDHTEVVQIEYDPERCSYADLLDVFWSNHDPRSNVAKTQYRNVVLTANADQRESAERTRKRVADRLGGAVATDIEQLDRFYLAENYHQKYELRSTPVLGDELTDIYDETLVDSTVAARLNGFVAGHGDEQQRRELLASLDLPPTVLSEIRRRV
jgi:peptide-methionine (S)-S-oxide reductase